MKLHMVDLGGQYARIKSEIDESIQEVLNSTVFIGGPVVNAFKENLQTYLNVKHVIPCANGTDSLQMALMAMDLQPGDEVILPAFTYVATAEVIALLKLKPVMIDVNPDDFNIRVEDIKSNISSKTKAIVPVHLFGQCANMEEIMKIAKEHHLYVIEDNAQAIGSDYLFQTEHHVNREQFHMSAVPHFFLPKIWVVMGMVVHCLPMMMKWQINSE